MSKRPLDGEGEDRPPKRSKPDQKDTKQQPLEEIHFARQLQQLLVFRQDGVPQLRRGIASFKAFLDNILYQQDADDRPRWLAILREYLESEKPVDANDTERPFLNQLWQAWSFATQNYNDHLVSSVSAIIALLLKTLSTVLDLRELGLLLCRTVLQHQHLRLIKRSLDAPKGKDFVISPCLRLLIEVASFDGGVVAKEVYKKREFTFDIGTIRRNLGLVRTDIPEEELHRKSSIRTWTVRYLLVLLKYLHEGAKMDILSSRPICSGLFAHLRDDPSELVIELLDIVEKHVLKDAEVSRSAKSSLLIQHNLERVTEVATRSQKGHLAAPKAFEWLKSVCSDPSYGHLRLSGWYPPGTTQYNNAAHSDDIIDLGLDSIDFYNQNTRPDIRNTTTLPWMLTLRPHSNLQERELVLLCFRSAPELVAAYFAEKNMSFEPKLTNTWIGYASFLFEVVQLPVPDHLGNEHEWADLPPQTDVMIENILPRPLTQKTLTRCMNSSGELVVFFAVRILILAFQKLAAVRSHLSKGAETSSSQADLWREASERLLTQFTERCPNMKPVTSAFRKTPFDDEHALQREAFSRLLGLYHEGTPLLAFEEQLDISVALTNALERASETDPSAVGEVKALELGHLLQVAKYNPSMRWFSKQGSLKYSPIVTLLKIHRDDLQNRPIRALIQHVLIESNIVNSNAACDAFVASLTEVTDDAYPAVANFLDECFSRVNQRPIKYLDDMETLCSTIEVEKSHRTQLPSLFIAVILEQAPFVATKPNSERDQLISWIGAYLDASLLSKTASMDEVVIEKVKSELGLWTVPLQPIDRSETLRKVTFSDSSDESHRLLTNGFTPKSETTFAPPPVEGEDHPELFKWAQKDLDIALEDGQIDALILCLSSQYAEIRTQAHTQIYKLQDRVQYSNLDDKNPIYVVLGELIETYEHHCLPKSTALPYLAGTFATKAIYVQRQPAHFMYTKVNAYLNKGPEWRIQKMPKYWMEHAILSTPTEDNTYWKEVEWTLEWLVDGLRSPADLEILRRAGVFERVMVLYCSPGANSRHNVKEKVMELLWRASYVPNGSTTLITRTGVLNWLGVVSGESGIETAIRERLSEQCDKQKVEEWGGMKLEEL